MVCQDITALPFALKRHYQTMEGILYNKCIHATIRIFGHFFFNPSFNVAMSGRAGVGSRASSEVYVLVNLFEKPVHNAVRRFSCLFSNAMDKIYSSLVMIIACQ